MNIARYLTQTAVLERANGPNTGFYDEEYAEPEAIAVRWFTESDLVRNAEGQEVTTSARITTLADIRLGDRVTDAYGREYDVVQVRRNLDVHGRYSHTVANLA